MLILLTTGQAAQVRGKARKGGKENPMATLEPVPLSDGRFILGVEVLDDPAHKARHEMLRELPTVPFEEIAHLLPDNEIA